MREERWSTRREPRDHASVPASFISAREYLAAVFHGRAEDGDCFAELVLIEQEVNLVLVGHFGVGDERRVVEQPLREVAEQLVTRFDLGDVRLVERRRQVSSCEIPFAFHGEMLRSSTRER